MKRTYPEVYYSNDIKQILESIPPFRPQPQYPSRPEDGGSCLISGLILGGLLCSFIGITFAINDGDYAGYLIFGGLCTSVLSFVIDNMIKQNKEKHFQNSSLMEQYRRDLLRWENDRANFLTQKRIQEFRKNKYINTPNYKFDAKVLSDIEGREEDVRIGISEHFFQQKLQQSGLFHMHGPMHLDRYPRSYYPDIVIGSLDHKILIDIEIDEPYVLGSNEEIHYIKDDGYSVDYERNKTFTDHGFCVIRFSEEQVILHHDECINYIVSIIDNIGNGIEHIPPSPKTLIRRKWNQQEAREMAMANYRNSYLPEHINVGLNIPVHIDVRNEPPTRYHEYNNDDLPF